MASKMIVATLILLSAAVFLLVENMSELTYMQSSDSEETPSRPHLKGSKTSVNSAKTEELSLFFTNNKLELYLDAFQAQGYDYVEDLLVLTEGEVSELTKSFRMKPGHATRLTRLLSDLNDNRHTDKADKAYRADSSSVASSTASAKSFAPCLMSQNVKGAMKIFYYIPTDVKGGTKAATLSTKVAQAQVAVSRLATSTNHRFVYVTVGQNIFQKQRCIRDQEHYHYPTGDEITTLALLHSYCAGNPDETVGYINNKGTEVDENLRTFATMAVMSDECGSQLKETCSICQGRFFPEPDFHALGNMWTARCKYINKLPSPQQFQANMNSMFRTNSVLRQFPADTVGVGEHAAKHWVGSHPDLVPCDLYDEEKDLYNGPSVRNPTAHWAPQQQLAPRFPLSKLFPAYWNTVTSSKIFSAFGKRNAAQIIATRLEYRLAEWQYHYKHLPDDNSWIWNYYSATESKKDELKTHFHGADSTQNFFPTLAPTPLPTATPTTTPTASPSAGHTFKIVNDPAPQNVGFFHMYDAGTGLLSPIVQEMQLSLMHSEVYPNITKIFYTIISANYLKYQLPVESDKYVKTDQSGPSGFEETTLDLLWQHCRERPQDIVFYQHSKGSYHASEKNDKYRRINHRAITAPCCVSSLASGEGNVCGWHFAWFPYFHVPGNMWWARCDYVRKLPKPSAAARRDIAMSATEGVVSYAGGKCPDFIVGAKRYIAERWIGLHPSFQVIDTAPAEAYGEVKYGFGVGGLPDLEYPFSCGVIPRRNNTPERYTISQTSNDIFGVFEPSWTGHLACASQTHKVVEYHGYFGSSWLQDLTSTSTACVWFRRMALTAKFFPERLPTNRSNRLVYENQALAETWLYDWNEHPALRKVCMEGQHEPYEEVVEAVSRAQQRHNAIRTSSKEVVDRVLGQDLSGFGGAFCSRCLPIPTTCHLYCSGAMGYDTGHCAFPGSTDTNRCCECHKGPGAKQLAHLIWGSMHTLGENARASTQLPPHEAETELDMMTQAVVSHVLEKPVLPGMCSECLPVPASCDLSCNWDHCECNIDASLDHQSDSMPCANPSRNPVACPKNENEREKRQLWIETVGRCTNAVALTAALNKPTVPGPASATQHWLAATCTLKRTIAIRGGYSSALRFTNQRGDTMLVERVNHWAWGTDYGINMTIILQPDVDIDRVNRVMYGGGHIVVTPPNDDMQASRSEYSNDFVIDPETDAMPCANFAANPVSCIAGEDQSRRLHIDTPAPCIESPFHSKALNKNVIQCPLKRTVEIKGGYDSRLLFTNQRGDSMEIAGVHHWSWGGRDMFVILPEGRTVENANKVMFGGGVITVTTFEGTIKNDDHST